SMRFRPPLVAMADNGVTSSFHNSTWCSKNTESPSARLISATGTSSPSTWQLLLENLNSVMSRSRGASFQPESLTRLRASSGAPQVPHVVCPESFWALHHWHSIRSMRAESTTGVRRANGVQKDPPERATPTERRAPLRRPGGAGSEGDLKPKGLGAADNRHGHQVARFVS